MRFDLIRMPFDRSRMSFDRASYLIRPPRQNTDLSDWVRCYLNTVIHYWNLIFRVNGIYWEESWKMDGSTPRSRGVLFARRTTILRKVLLKRIKKPGRGEWEFLSNNNNYMAEDFRFFTSAGSLGLHSVFRHQLLQDLEFKTSSKSISSFKRQNLILSNFSPESPSIKNWITLALQNNLMAYSYDRMM